MTQQTHGCEIAIIGMAGQFPGAPDIEAYWRNIEAGIESIRDLTQQELSEGGLSARATRPHYVSRGGYLEGIEEFDAGLFGYSAGEARLMDPQHRLFLETVWQALEHAGCAPDQFSGQIGVFAGAAPSTYLIENIVSNRSVLRHIAINDLLHENLPDLLATRVCYKLNLTGPGIVVGSACSSSLTLTHFACQSLLAGDCDIALAGGVRIGVPHWVGYDYAEGGILSRDGHCRTFDVNSSGTTAGSGVAVVVLRRLEDAIAAGDTIHAVIKATAVNNDGARKVGYTAPSVEGQADVIRKALIAADVPAESIGYIEAHGTATRLGDPIEIKALTQAYRELTDRKQFCAIGSVKANIGHLDAAAGVAGLIKVVQILKQGVLPPAVSFTAPNPETGLEQSPFYVPQQRRAWKAAGVRRAAVSAFGIGGTNAHAVLEESTFTAPSGPSRARQLLCFSAKTRAALLANVKNFSDWLQSSPPGTFADAAYTLKTGRMALEYRCSFVCEDANDAVAALSRYQPAHPNFAKHSQRPVVFMFSGQGAQYPGMTEGLYQTEPVFRATVDRCAELLTPALGLDIRGMLFPADGAEEVQVSPLRRTRYTQPALFVVEYALVELLKSWGITPKACIGHSVGEYVAACVAGVLSLEDALSLVVARATAMDEAPPGAMLSVELGPEEVQNYLSSEVAIAARNAPELCVVSGDPQSIAELEQALVSDGISVKRLRTSHAFHSPMMDECGPKLIAAFGNVRLNAPLIPFISCVTGDWITRGQATCVEYWAQQLRAPVEFSRGISRVLEDESAVLLEVGPGTTLTSLAATHAADDRKPFVLASVRDRRLKVRDDELLLSVLGRMWSLGVNVSWAGFYQHEQRRKIVMPTYAFQRQRYWLEKTAEQPARHDSASHSELDSRLAPEQWFHQSTWTQTGSAPRLDPSPDTRWLLFLDALEVGKRLESRLTQAGARVWTVRKGRSFKQLSERCVQIHPTRAEDYQKLFALLAQNGATPDKIVSCWNVTTNTRLAESYDQFEALLQIAKACTQAGTHSPIDFYVLSNQLHAVVSGEPVNPLKSLLIGPCRVIPKEFGGVRCKSIDITIGRNPLLRWSKVLDFEALLAELYGTVDESFVALRGRQRFVPAVQPAPLETVAGSGLYRQNETYLITGAFGGIGSTFARFLSQRHRAKLILVSRGELPAEKEWDSWLRSHDPSNVKSQRIRLLKDLQAVGCSFHVICADVADTKEMKKGLKLAQRRLGPVAGVLHCAGIADGALIQRRVPSDSRSVFQSKVAGTFVLDKLLRRQRLDFFVQCSSLASLIGPVGQVAYCSANAFQDAFAQSRCTRVGTTQYLTLAWDSWKEVGMAVDTLNSGNRSVARPGAIAHGLTPNDGVDVLNRALASGHGHFFISTRGWPLNVEETASSAADPAMENTAALQPLGSVCMHSRPPLGTAFVAPRNALEERIRDIWQDKLGVGPLGVFDDFFELNGHSLMAVQIVTEIRRQLHATLPAGVIYDNSTIAQLAASVAEQTASRAYYATTEA